MTELDTGIPLDEAAHWLGTAIEAVVENYGEYVDYNSIATQSDRGEMLYTLLDFLRLCEFRPDRLESPAGGGRPRNAGSLRPRRRADFAPRAVGRRPAPMANEHLRRFNALCEAYRMQLPSIAEHLAERFVRPLEIDRLYV